MSHFSVLVVGDNIEEQLRPFQENNMGDCPSEYLSFHDVTDSSRKDYEKDTTHVYVDPSGNKFCKYDERFRNPEYDFIKSPDAEKYICPIGWEEKEIPVKELHPDFDEYMTEYCGNEIDEKTGKYGYWENRNAKWDWYAVGGRWAGKLRIKPDVADQYKNTSPNFSWGWDERARAEVLKSVRVDQARFGDIDFETPKDEAATKAAAIYDTVYPVVKDLPLIRPWQEYVADVESGALKSYDEAREQYHAQPRVIAINKLSRQYRNDDSELGRALGWLDDLECFNASRETYIRKARENANSTFAVLKNGKWFERGKMGWWACVSDEKDRETWNSMIDNLLADVSPDTMITIVDCHI